MKRLIREIKGLAGCVPLLWILCRLRLQVALQDIEISVMEFMVEREWCCVAYKCVYEWCRRWI